MHENPEIILETVAYAVFLGILAQVIAQRFKIPAILPLLLFGMAAGPFALGILHPESLGHTLEALVHLGVAVILFEGGLSLDIRQLRSIGGPLRNLLTLGTLVTGVGGAWLAHVAVGISWSTAALFGAIVTVTGPTVIAPLLRHMVVPAKVRTLLLSEGLMIDPIGAVLAYFVLQWIERTGMEPKTLLFELFAVGATGAILGFVAGSLAVFVVRYRHMHDELRNLVILAVLLGSFAVAEGQAPQSGVMAAVVMGLTVSAAHIPDLNPLKVFKSQLTVLFISILFILLSGQLDLEAMYDLGFDGLLVVAGLIFLIRPLAVLVSMPFNELSLKEKSVLALNAPRGIVAAAVASVSAIQLRSEGATADAALLEGLVYLTILVTCAWSTLMAPLLPRFLGYYDDPARRRVVLVGANPLSEAFARLFREAGWMTAIVDSVPRKLLQLREKGLRTVRGDARDASTYEQAEVDRDTKVVALTTNDELNLLIAELVREEFGVEHPTVAMQQPSTEFGQLRRAWVDLLGNRGLELQKLFRRMDDDKARLHNFDLQEAPENPDALATLLREMPECFVPLCGWREGQQPSFRLTLDDLTGFQRVTVLMLDEGGLERWEQIRQSITAESQAAEGPTAGDEKE